MIVRCALCPATTDNARESGWFGGIVGEHGEISGPVCSGCVSQKAIVDHESGQLILRAFNDDGKVVKSCKIRYSPV